MRRRSFLSLAPLFVAGCATDVRDEGDVPSVRIHQPLQYVGHLKFDAPAAG